MKKTDEELFDESIRVATTKQYYFNIFVYPAVLIHELFHWIFGLLFGWGIGRIRMGTLREYDGVSGIVYYHSLFDNIPSLFTQVIVSFAPIFSFIIPLFLSYFLSPWILIWLIYSLITWNYSIPSYSDVIDVVYYNTISEIKNSPCILEYDIVGDAFYEKKSRIDLIKNRKQYNKELLKIFNECKLKYIK